MTRKPTTRDLVAEAAEAAAEVDPAMLAQIAAEADASSALRRSREALPPVAIPPAPMPESGEAMMERLKSAGLVATVGVGADAEQWHATGRRLVITEHDGRGGLGRTSSVLVDPSFDAWLVVETSAPMPGRPGELEQVHARVGLHSVASLEFVDDDGA